MKKYIDADRLKQFLKPEEWGTPDERWIPEHEIGAMLDYFPAADVQEVQHGRWITKGQDIFCSVCGEESAYTWYGASKFSNYCPNCGAKMDEVSE